MCPWAKKRGSSDPGDVVSWGMTRLRMNDEWWIPQVHHWTAQSQQHYCQSKHEAGVTRYWATAWLITHCEEVRCQMSHTSDHALQRRWLCKERHITHLTDTHIYAWESVCVLSVKMLDKQITIQRGLWVSSDVFWTSNRRKRKRDPQLKKVFSVSFYIRGQWGIFRWSLHLNVAVFTLLSHLHWPEIAIRKEKLHLGVAWCRKRPLELSCSPFCTAVTDIFHLHWSLHQGFHSNIPPLALSNPSTCPLSLHPFLFLLSARLSSMPGCWRTASRSWSVSLWHSSLLCFLFGHPLMTQPASLLVSALWFCALHLFVHGSRKTHPDSYLCTLCRIHNMRRPANDILSSSFPASLPFLSSLCRCECECVCRYSSGFQSLIKCIKPTLSVKKEVFWEVGSDNT